MNDERSEPAVAASALATLLDAIAAPAPTPGAGPSAAWTCAIAAALVEMVSAVAVAKGDATGHAGRRGERARDLRQTLLALADADADAYRDVLLVSGRRHEAGYAEELRAALSRAADPPVAIAEAAAEVTRLAAEAAAQARGGVRGEAITAAVLGEAVVRAAARIVDLNLGGRADPRRTRVAALAASAAADLERSAAR